MLVLNSFSELLIPNRTYMARMTPPYNIAASAKINQNVLGPKRAAPMFYFFLKTHG